MLCLANFTAPSQLNKQSGQTAVQSETEVINQPQPETERPLYQEIALVEELPPLEVQEKAPVAPIAPKPTTTPVAGCEQLRSLLVQHGLNSSEVEAALQIAKRESSCNSGATNKSSGACNFFQEYPCGKWGGQTDIAGHIAGADSYAKNRYGGWLGALSFWQNNHWW